MFLESQKLSLNKHHEKEKKELEKKNLGQNTRSQAVQVSPCSYHHLWLQDSSWDKSELVFDWFFEKI